MAGQAELKQTLDAWVRRATAPRLSRLMRSPLRIARLRMMRSPTTVRARTFWGESMLVTPPEPLSKQLKLYGFFEEGLTRFMLDRLAPGMTVIDVGAHYGYFTLLAAHLVGGAGSVHAFEPTPSSYRLLERNVAGRLSVRTNPYAVWSRESELDLQDFGTESSMFNSVFAPRGELGTGIIVKVHAVPLDAYIDRLELAPDFIKIDAESAEAHVIAGLAATLKRDRPALTVEVGDLSPDQPISSRELLRMICERYGYEPFEFSGGAIRPHQPKEHYGYDNVLLDHPKRSRDPPSRHQQDSPAAL